MAVYFEENCALTLIPLADKVQHDFGVILSTSTVLNDKLITLKQHSSVSVCPLCVRLTV
ncbi:hypothetical protein DVH05_026329 [Phytophthora capsici]|nr:hypothetical protein DVH05_026329 [Phytophthora capsici]